MLTSTPEANEQLNRVVTYPVYLIETGYGPQRYNSTGPNITTLGQSWISGKTDMSGMADGQSLNVIIDNSDYALTSSAQLGEWRGLDVNVWLCVIRAEQYYPHGIYETGIYESGVYESEIIVPLEVVSTFKLFSGEYVSAANVATDQIRLTAQRSGIDTNFTPRQRANEPLFNHLPSPGTVVQLGNETLVIE